MSAKIVFGLIIIFLITGLVFGFVIGKKYKKEQSDTFEPVKTEETKNKEMESVVPSVIRSEQPEAISPEAAPVVVSEKKATTPVAKLVMCLKRCNSNGELISDNIIHHPGESAQDIRACFGNPAAKCPPDDVTKNAVWSTSSSILQWTRDFSVGSKEVADDVYPAKTLKINSLGTAYATVQYKGYSYSVQINSQQAN